MPIDSSRKFHGPAELASLVDAIYRKDATVQETNWVEWKSTADLSDERWWAEIGVQIVGFANRVPNVASGKCEGFAYLALGVEPGRVDGVMPVDPSVLQQGVAAYVGHGPRWDPTYIDSQGKQVLVIEVAPPRWGDPLYSVRKPFSHRTYTVDARPYVRGHGRTAPATPTELDELVARAKRAPRPTFELVWRDSPGAIQRVDLSAEAQDSWRRTAAEELFGATRNAERLALGVSPFMAGLGYDNRTSEQRRRDAAEYLSNAMGRLRARAMANVARMKLGRLAFDLQNLGEENYAAVEVELVIPGLMAAGFEPDDFGWRDDLAFPEPPGRSRPWFDALSSIRSPITTPPPPRGSVENVAKHAVVTFAPEDLRPLRRAPLWAIYALSLSADAPAEVRCRWSATSKTASGEASGTIVIPVTANTLAVRDLVTARGTAPSRAGDDEEQGEE